MARGGRGSSGGGQRSPRWPLPTPPLRLHGARSRKATSAALRNISKAVAARYSVRCAHAPQCSHMSPNMGRARRATNGATPRAHRHQTGPRGYARVTFTSDVAVVVPLDFPAPSTRRVVRRRPTWPSASRTDPGIVWSAQAKWDHHITGAADRTAADSRCFGRPNPAGMCARSVRGRRAYGRLWRKLFAHVGAFTR